MRLGRLNDAGAVVGSGRRAFLLRPPSLFRTGFETGHTTDWSHSSGSP